LIYCKSKWIDKYEESMVGKLLEKPFEGRVERFADE